VNLGQIEMNVDGRAVANFVLDHCAANNRKISNLALQKIVYFCHVWSLVELGKPLVKHSFEAWQHGPVLQYLYQQFKSFDRQPIDKPATRVDPVSNAEVKVEEKFEADTETLLHRVVEYYSKFSASYLVEITHERGGPWECVWNHKHIVNPGMKISNKDIVDFYSRVPAPFKIQ
jgi:uncharacterized phage-associated protein